MASKQVKKLKEKKQSFKVGSEVFFVDLPDTELKQGRSVKEIIEAMKKASKRKLLKDREHATSFGVTVTSS